MAAQPVLAQSVPAAGDAPGASPQAATASPAATSAPSTTVNDIIVTANRREEYAQKVGVSLTAVSGASLAEHDIQSTEQLQNIVPGFNATISSGSGVAVVVIRGAGESDFSDHEEQPNASYQDGVYIPFATAASIPLFDRQRVEVLRGPQGTLFGRNATGGLIQYVSNTPTPGFSAGMEVAGGSRDLYRIQGYLDGGDDKIADRFSYYFQNQNGFIDNVLGRNRGDREVSAYRNQTSFNLAPDTKVTFRINGFWQSGTAPGYKAEPAYTNAAGVDTQIPSNLDVYGTGPGNDKYGYRNTYSGLKVALSDPGSEDKNSHTGSLTLEKQLGQNATLTALTAYGYIRSYYREDTDSTPIDYFDANVESRAYDFQQDLRLNGSIGRFRYTTGAYYLYVNGRYELNNTYPTAFNPAGGNGYFQYNQYFVRTQSEAIYGQAEYDVTDRITLIAGGRYTWDQLRLNLRTRWFETADPGAGVGTPSGATISGPFPVAVPGIGPLNQNNSDSDWSGKLQLNYTPYSDLLLYTSLSKGFKSAGFTAPLSPPFPQNELDYKPERLYAAEVGEKAQFLNKRVTMNASSYYYDYNGMQNFLFTGTLVQVLNLNARAYGFEYELAARPFKSVTAYANAAYNHFLIYNVPFAANNTPQRPNLAPRITYSWGVGKTFDLPNSYKLAINYSGHYVGQVFYNILNVPLDRAPPYSLANFEVRIDAPRRYWIAAYIDNAFNKTNQVGAFDVAYDGFTLRQYGEPLTASVAIGAKF